MKTKLIMSVLTIMFLSCLKSYAKPFVEKNVVSKSDIYKAVEYKTILVDSLKIFYREAGEATKPTIILLHGFPSSSHMYRNLIDELAHNYHVIAPDYPGFGQSSAPTPQEYQYTFDNLSITIEHFIDKLKIMKTSFYIQDYGGPVGMRIATRRPELIQSLIIQNANAYVEGLGGVLKPLIAYVENQNAETEKAARFFLTIDATKGQYLTGAGMPETIAPDSYSIDQYYLDRKGNDVIQLALFRDYGSNIALYEKWHQYFAKYKPPLLVIWGKNDQFFTAAGANAYKKDSPNAEIHLLSGGHFALEEHHLEISKLIINFLSKKVK
ncbi:alpha/beta hydrolase [Flavobacterium sp. MC2016-06]|uniref:alpha/beta fold hydrolase n=1 Tax=Flavobacterium sp. MC2016-06 TaxID=2676308 RepID=UPI001C0ABBCC|nr:alpha/beta hydrolase [Flavobacterium sp. MC2016-06]MBU3862285.1 alpha/beta hydrolase [Flavobacterium sp. MC2016-06]